MASSGKNLSSTTLLIVIVRGRWYYYVQCLHARRVNATSMATVGVNAGTRAALILDRALALTTVAIRLAYLKAPITFTASVTTTLNATALLNASLPSSSETVRLQSSHMMQ
ncbi:hypothetical protein EJB05_26028, partial [Eragrostis curvula]